MNATANSGEMLAKGIEPRFFSRANDRRRGGFIESQGGGTVLLTRGSIALELGLPVAGVVGFVHSYADGAHTSIPAPGLGALAAGMGGRESKLVRDLAALGVAPDDIAVVSNGGVYVAELEEAGTTRPPMRTIRTNPSCTTRSPMRLGAPTATRCS